MRGNSSHLIVIAVLLIISLPAWAGANSTPVTNQNTETTGQAPVIISEQSPSPINEQAPVPTTCPEPVYGVGDPFESINEQAPWSKSVGTAVAPTGQTYSEIVGQSSGDPAGQAVQNVSGQTTGFNTERPPVQTTCPEPVYGVGEFSGSINEQAPVLQPIGGAAGQALYDVTGRSSENPAGLAPFDVSGQNTGLNSEQSPGSPNEEAPLMLSDPVPVDIIGQATGLINEQAPAPLPEKGSGEAAGQTLHDVTGRSSVNPAGLAPFDVSGQTTGLNSEQSLGPLNEEAPSPLPNKGSVDVAGQAPSSITEEAPVINNEQTTGPLNEEAPRSSNEQPAGPLNEVAPEPSNEGTPGSINEESPGPTNEEPLESPNDPVKANIYSLQGAYPNPFNPTTTIRFQIAAAGQISLKVYNAAGRLVSTLDNSRREAGCHEVQFNGVNLPSGMYFYRLQAGEFAALGKMLLVK